MDETDLTFIKLTTYNNSGAFGSDIVKYRLQKEETILGEISHDIYYDYYNILFDNRIFLMKLHFWKGVIIYDSVTQQKIAKVGYNFSFFGKECTIKILFGKKDCLKFTVQDFNREKAMRINCTGLMADMVIDILVQNPRPDEMLMLREKPLSGIITAKDHPDPFRTLCVLAALEYLILYFDKYRNKRF